MVDLLRIAKEAVKRLNPQHGAIGRVKEGFAITLPGLSFTLTADRLEITEARLRQHKLEQIVAWLAHRLGFERIALSETGALSSPNVVAAAPDLVARLREKEEDAGVDADNEDQRVEGGSELDDDGYDGPGF
ncbi:MAG TPA: hypothetical protein GX700_11440 [Paracoccus sp.]|nr:hypothetical protein [Paracoccus sp. (in: a-proteobacteria)]